MNKEVKIGLTIILVLLVTFVAVLAKRLYSSHAAERSLAAENTGEEKTEALANTKTETSNNEVKEKNTIAPVGQPTLVAATAVSDKPPRGSASDEDLWNTASDIEKVNNSDGSQPDLNPPPSYMPEPPKADAENRYDRHRTSAAGDSTDYRYTYRREHANSSAGAVRPYTVAEGDSLFDIARCELGKASRWVEIYDLNLDLLGKDIDSLAAGTQIVLPEGNAQTADPLSPRSRTDYRK